MNNERVVVLLSEAFGNLPLINNNKQILIKNFKTFSRENFKIISRNTRVLQHGNQKSLMHIVKKNFFLCEVKENLKNCALKTSSD